MEEFAQERVAFYIHKNRHFLERLKKENDYYQTENKQMKKIPTVSESQGSRLRSSQGKRDASDIDIDSV